MTFRNVSSIAINSISSYRGKIDWNNFSDSFSVVVDSLFWFSLICYLFNTSSSWHEPVLTFSHWEPNIFIFLSHFCHEVDWFWEVW